MYKIAILGCENSHANGFLNYIIKDKKCTDVEVLGVYSDETEAAQKLSDEFGVYVMKSYDEFAGKLDGVVITARHGDNHYKYAKPYIKDGIPMFIDKPITVTEEDAVAFKKELIDNKIKACGGSMCVFSDGVQSLKKLVSETDKADIYGGFLRAPINLDNIYGRFFFYTQHLAEVTCEIFGYYPNSVKAFKCGNSVNCTLRYDNYDIALLYGESATVYSATVCLKDKNVGNEYPLDGCSDKEFLEFYELLKGGEMHKSYDDLFAPVYVLNAMNRSLISGKEEKINR